MTKEQYLSANPSLYLSNREREHEESMNTQNDGYFSNRSLMKLARRHRDARKEEDYKTMVKIEYRLADANYYIDCNAMRAGDYNKILKGSM